MANRFEKLNKLRERLIESSHDFRASTEIFPSLNVERVAADLELDEVGAARGADNRPAPSAKAMDDIELSIIERIEEEKKSSHHVLEDNLQLFSDRLASLDFEEQFGLIRQANAASVSDFKGEVTLGLDELHGLRRSLNTAETEHSWFREKHRLVRAARLPEGGAYYFKWAFILFLLLLETALNGTFLAQGSEEGLLGGIVEAFSFSVVNIGVALLLAIFGARLVTHKAILAKFIGVAAIITYVVVAICINMALAHFREIAGSGDFSIVTGRETMLRLQSDPLGLADIESWLLFALGLFFSIAAFIDGWFMFDPYPGYAGVQKRLDRKRENYIARKEELIEKLKEIRDEHNERVAEIIGDLGKRRREYRAIIEHRAKVLSLFQRHQDQLERACNQLLQRYREANAKARTQPAPKYYSNPWKMDRIKPRVVADGEWTDKELSESIRKAQEELNEQVKKIGRECEQGIEKYQELDNLHADKLHG